MITIMSGWHHLFDGAPRRLLESGQILFRRGDAVRCMYFVRSGVVALERPMEDGTALTLHLAGAGTALAEASLFADAYHCDAIARTASVVSATDRADFLGALRAAPDAALDLLKAHAQEVQAQRARIEVLRLRRVADKLDAWLDLHGEPAKGEWVSVADQIGVSPAALYRELASRRL